MALPSSTRVNLSENYENASTTTYTSAEVYDNEHSCQHVNVYSNKIKQRIFTTTMMSGLASKGLIHTDSFGKQPVKTWLDYFLNITMMYEIIFKFVIANKKHIIYDYLSPEIMSLYCLHFVSEYYFYNGYVYSTINIKVLIHIYLRDSW